MMTPVQRLAALNLVLPASTQAPDDLHLPFVPINMRGNQRLISGHPKTSLDRHIVGPYGQVGRDLTTEQAKLVSRDITFLALSNLKN